MQVRKSEKGGSALTKKDFLSDGLPSSKHPPHSPPRMYARKSFNVCPKKIINESSRQETNDASGRETYNVDSITSWKLTLISHQRVNQNRNVCRTKMMVPESINFTRRSLNVVRKKNKLKKTQGANKSLGRCRP